MKNSLIAVFAGLAVVLMITGCWNKTADPIVLPDSGEVASVAVTTTDGTQLSYTDEEWIAQLLSVISDAQATDKASIQELPSADRYGQIDIYSDKVSTIFYYEEDGKYYIEQPYQGIYETDVNMEDFVK